MTTSTADTHEPPGRRLVAASTFLIAVGLPVAAILTAGAREVEIQPGLIDWIFVAAIAAVTVATFGLLVPWAERPTPRPTRPSTTGFTLSAVAFAVAVVLFWTMVPVIFGVAGAWLGHVARDRAGRGGRGARLATAAMVIGAIAVLGSVAAYIATS